MNLDSADYWRHPIPGCISEELKNEEENHESVKKDKLWLNVSSLDRWPEGQVDQRNISMMLIMKDWQWHHGRAAGQ